MERIKIDSEGDNSNYNHAWAGLEPTDDLNSILFHHTTDEYQTRLTTPKLGLIVFVYNHFGSKEEHKPFQIFDIDIRHFDTKDKEFTVLSNDEVINLCGTLGIDPKDFDDELHNGELEDEVYIHALISEQIIDLVNKL